MRHRLCYMALSVLLLLLLAADISCGSVFIPLSHLWQEPSLYSQILLDLRVPKAITAILAGVALSVSGLLMQTLFRNPLAGPYILGVSSGATLGVAITTMCATLTFLHLPSFLMASPLWGGAAGALLVLLLVLSLSRRVTSNVSLLIIGVMLGSIASSFVSLIQSLSNPDSLKLFIVWTLGSLSSVGWSELRILAPVCILTFAFVIFFVMKPLNGLLLGESYAEGLGINVHRTRIFIVLATGLLAGSVTAYCGPIAFVGVAVPHIARGLFRTTNHRHTIPACALIGANLLLLCDLLCSLSTYPLPISTMSALFGAPIIIYILLRK